MNRAELQKLARQRVRDSKALLEKECWAGAYYLAGYAIECALKSCIAKKTKRYDFPPDRKIINEIYTHSLTKLVEAAGLKTSLDSETAAFPELDSNWNTVKDWSEDKRYSASISQHEALDLYIAITHRKHGILKWVRKCW